MAGTDASAADGTALLIIDMINDLRFEEATAILPAVRAAAEAIVTLRAAADAHDVPVIYVNDNYGQWHSERSRLIERALEQAGDNRDLIRGIVPRDRDLFVIKPQFSGFYATNLPVVLPRLGVRRLILTGIAADICVLFTAADAHMRDYALWVPGDTVAGLSADRTRWALEIMETSMKADIRPTTVRRLDDWLGAAS
ncbi:MAG TPA: isochorismatase family cysteine hydrolase [Sphingomonas sp.]|jgi:nicotinamidase-related amidase|uniref:isochorismatase family cysteine hydrolase n=1 Tax=Sphingomonas sp. TaxID=28214 RepID=UPI002ED96662